MIAAPGIVTWLLACIPVVALLGLVLSPRVTTRSAAVTTLGLAAALAATRFRAPLGTLIVALEKGAWLSAWILAVVWPALLLYRIASAGGLDDLGDAFTSLLSRREDRLLAVAWVLLRSSRAWRGSDADRGSPAPILVALGWSPVKSIVYPLIGYHWAVTFGSMGSSFYMASLTSGLTGAAEPGLAVRAALLLAVNSLVAPVIVLAMDGGLASVRRGARTVLVAGADGRHAGPRGACRAGGRCVVVGWCIGSPRGDGHRRLRTATHPRGRRTRRAPSPHPAPSLRAAARAGPPGLPHHAGPRLGERPPDRGSVPGHGDGTRMADAPGRALHPPVAPTLAPSSSRRSSCRS